MRSYQAQGIERQPERKYLPSEIRQPDSKQQLIDFRHAREQAQHRVYDAHSLQQGMGSTIERFEAYKRNQSDMAQEQQQTAQREREGSNTAKLPIQAPLNPKAIRTNGPRQQAEARMAASPPVKSAPRPVFGSDMRLSFRIEIG